MSLNEIHGHVARWMQLQEPWAEAVLIGVRRSAPRAPGARFAVTGDGSIAGSISAGCVEADLREHMLQALETGDPRVLSYGITDEMAMGVGLACGGEIDVLVRCHQPHDAVWSSLTKLLDGASETRAQAALLTGLSSDILGRQLLVRPEGDTVGSLGDLDADRLVPDVLDRLFAREGGESLDLAPEVRVFVDRVLPPRRLVVVGAGPAAAALSLMAPAVGYRVTVVDPRSALTASEAFEGVDVRVGWPADVLAAEGLDEWTDVAVLAHDERIDVEALVAAIRAGCRYVGLLGGSRTQKARREALISAGASPAEAARIRGPIGLDIGAATPAEIAASILAELIAVRRLGGQPD